MLYWALLLICMAGSGAAQSLAPLKHAEKRQWSAIGAIARSHADRVAGCSGALVAPDLVLTAAHCAFAAREKPRELIFAVAGLGRGALSSFAASKIELHPKYTQVPTKLERFGVDFALVTLARRVPEGMARPLPVYVAPEGSVLEGVFALLGFDRTAPTILKGRFDCLPSLPGVPRPLQLTCPVVSGNSGAPVMLRTEDGWQIIGVAVARIGRGPGSQSLVAVGDAWLADRLASHTTR